MRLDASDVIDKDFLSSLAGFCKSKKNGFWLMGEVVHGDYTQWACKDRIDSVTDFVLMLDDKGTVIKPSDKKAEKTTDSKKYLAYGIIALVVIIRKQK